MENIVHARDTLRRDATVANDLGTQAFIEQVAHLRLRPLDGKRFFHRRERGQDGVHKCDCWRHSLPGVAR